MAPKYIVELGSPCNLKSYSDRSIQVAYPSRVLSRIYRLGETSRVAEGHDLPRGVRGYDPGNCL